ncbi:MAG TPA: hypothetical protein VIZ31_12440, partial [Vicinamibacteria bacterium]
SPRILDVPSLEISGDIRVNGLAPPESVYESARLSLAAENGPDRALLGDTPAGHYSARVVPGRYDIVYEHLAGSGNIMPSNPRATLARGWRVAAQPSRSIDIPAGTYEASFLLNGEAFPETAYDSGRIYLVPLKGGGEPVVLGFTYDGGVARRLLPGVYRSAYAREAGGTIVPTNSFTTFGPLVRVRQGEGPAALSDVLDVRAAGLSVSYEHNGVPLPEGGPENARLHLHRGDNYLQLLDSAQGTSERIAMEGTFDLFYEYRGGPDLPRNAFMRFGCWDLLR